MKNLGMVGRNNTRSLDLRHVLRSTLPSLGRRGEPAWKWIGFQPLFKLGVSQRIRAAFIKDGGADYANIARVAILLVSVRFAHRAEAERRHCFDALPKALDHKLRARGHDISSLR